jgi:trimethylguanosine synthase
MATETNGKPSGEAHHYEEVSEMPHEISKYEISTKIPFPLCTDLLCRYWHQRHNIWSKYDEGIWMTDDAWFGVTPEPVAT